MPDLVAWSRRWLPEPTSNRSARSPTERWRRQASIPTTSTELPPPRVRASSGHSWLASPSPRPRPGLVSSPSSGSITWRVTCSLPGWISLSSRHRPSCCWPREGTARSCMSRAGASTGSSVRRSTTPPGRPSTSWLATWGSAIRVVRPSTKPPRAVILRPIRFPRALADQRYNFSFSGLKTSVVTFLEKTSATGTLPPLADVAASLQEAIVDVLVEKTFNAVEDTGVESIGAGGGVLANRRLSREAHRRSRIGAGSDCSYPRRSSAPTTPP